MRTLKDFKKKIENLPDSKPFILETKEGDEFTCIDACSDGKVTYAILKRNFRSSENYTILENKHESYAEFSIFRDEEEVARGSIKWDGCSNWEFHDSHFCGIEQMKEFHETVQKCYTMASDMKNWLTNKEVRSW